MRIITEHTIVVTTETQWPEAYDGMSLAEAIAHEKDASLETAVENIAFAQPDSVTLKTEVTTRGGE
jgi:hypothetical protein